MSEQDAEVKDAISSTQVKSMFDLASKSLPRAIDAWINTFGPQRLTLRHTRPGEGPYLARDWRQELQPLHEDWQRHRTVLCWMRRSSNEPATIKIPKWKWLQPRMPRIAHGTTYLLVHRFCRIVDRLSPTADPGPEALWWVWAERLGVDEKLDLRAEVDWKRALVDERNAALAMLAPRQRDGLEGTRLRWQGKEVDLTRLEAKIWRVMQYRTQLPLDVAVRRSPEAIWNEPLRPVTDPTRHRRQLHKIDDAMSGLSNKLLNARIPFRFAQGSGIIRKTELESSL